MTGDIVVRRLVKRRRVNARLHHLSHEVERPIINDAALLDSLDVRFILDDAVRRTHLSAINVELHRAQALIEIHMAFLVLLAAAAPAQIVSRHFIAPRSRNFDRHAKTNPRTEILLKCAP